MASQARSYGEGLGQGANSVLGKARLILEAFELDDMDLSLSELSRRTGISKASVHRLAQELLDWGMLERSGQEYRLGMRAFELGSRVPRFRVLRDAARPFMESLHFATKETILLYVRDGRELLCVEKIASGPEAAKPSKIARRAPLHCTSSGKVLLAYSPTSVVEDVISGGLARLTPSTTVAPGMLIEQLRKARENGFATEMEEVVQGYCSVGVPIFSSSQLVLGALSIVAPTFRADVPKLTQALMATTSRLSRSTLLN
ncbi:IclR family transcriptional regulator [Nocardioides nitrophenolicus]|uniref:IclR family transcriptional regulator n=1 Tax=Nocardioides nitrophenolicus TaxID=60489 RepID=UPI0019599513|nr:IclR family transcriptional regulator [Nocardioides nitrophenolicus]MBM7517061.1 DNA-binding IclR family transcriptional regulator [Nocardioides nitrophenolicus]